MSSSPIATYSFLPWLKGGLANQITSADGASVPVRAAVDVRLVVATDNAAIPAADRTVDTQVQLIGPGDVLGINPDVVVKTQPRDWITDFEPNYIPFIEFYDEDFPWRYTPAAADATRHRLRPWLTLVVLKAAEFEELSARTGPLSAVRVVDAQTKFPHAPQLWAWAHVHVNEDLTADRTRDLASSMNAFGQIVSAHPDRAYSRLMCPRKLEPETEYHAFLIPTFESGRLAGLGLEIPPALRATENAWGVNPALTDFPYYYRWFFRTGTVGDFEYLVRLLEPKPMDERVGVREMDARTPGPAVAGIADDIRLEGALKCPPPGALSTNWPDPYPQPFQTTLRALLNTPAEYARAAPGTDPVIAPPIYGARHALIEELTPGNRDWVHELNLDPRNRVPAGFGTEVIQEHQERYMNEAWRQVGDVLAANQKIRNFQLGLAASLTIHQRSLAAVPAAAALTLTAPVHTRVLTAGATVFAAASTGGSAVAPLDDTPTTLARRLDRAVVPPTLFAPGFRRVVRPRSTVFTRLSTAGPTGASWVERVNAGDITATPPKVTPPGVLDTAALQDELKPSGFPAWLAGVTRRPALFFLLVLVLLVVLLFLFGLGVVGLALVGLAALGAVALWVLGGRYRRDEDAARAAGEAGWTRAAVADVPPAPNFRITAPGDTSAAPAGTTSGPDSRDAADFRAAASDLFALFEAIPPAPPPHRALSLSTAGAAVLEAVDPRATHVLRLEHVVNLAPPLRRQWARLPRTVMAYPEFTEAMYKPLADKSSELLLPNIHLITQNTISLLVTNQRFIESYMVGLNHEFMRELLWREYPTDRQGTPFRQFWDVSNYVNTDPSLTPAQLREKLKDIKPIHTWEGGSALGSHNQREDDGDAAQLVLVVRGDVLKKYPNTVIYANRAAWQRRADGSIDRGKPRLLDESAGSQKFPLYGAKVAPDIHFIGFDLTVEEVRGGTGETGTDLAGWFFVLQERPGEPRFGLDMPLSGPLPPLRDWDDLTWGHVATQNEHISLTTSVALAPPPTGTNNNPENVAWNPNTNSADVAHILYQDPVLVAVHAAEMLRGV